MSNTEERSWLEPYAPLGINLAKEVMVFVVCMTAACMYSFLYIVEYVCARDELYDFVNEKKVIIEGAKMAPFSDLLGNHLLGFVIVMLAMVGICIYHYAYHYMDSKVVYLMKRLPSKWEMHKRCLILPIAGILVAAVFMAALWGIYYGIYLLFTPQQCLPL